MTWHPDRNRGKDTTQQMIDINEAYGILKNHDSKSRYDLYYDKVFANTSNHSDLHHKGEKEESYYNQSKQHYQSTHSEPHNHSSFDYVDDDILKDKIQQERQNAEKIVRDFIKNLNKDATIAAKGATNSCLIYMVIAIILNIIFFIAYS